MKFIRVKYGKEKSILHHHPWVFKSAFEETSLFELDKDIIPGEIVEIQDYKGSFLAFAYYNPDSNIRARILEWNKEICIDRNWWKKKIEIAIKNRSFINNTNALRLIYAEADGLPGLIVDRYGDYLVLQALTAGIDLIKMEIAEILDELISPVAIYEKSDADVRSLEGLHSVKGIISGRDFPEEIIVNENGIKYYVNVKEGQKTGFYTDQRKNRLIAGKYCEEMDVLDCFCYTGGFTLNALNNNAKSVVSIDSSSIALNFLKRNIELNRLPFEKCELIEGDAFVALRKFRDIGRKFDIVILDPPKLAPTHLHKDKALRAYKDINLLALKLIKPGGFLISFSCSGGISIEDFKLMISWAGIDAHREVQVLHTLHQSPDHPILLSYPESEYLKGIIGRVI